MSLKNLFALSLTTLACAALVGCAATRHPNGLPKRLDDASEASRFAYFMGLQVEDQRAPEGFDPAKSSQLATDVAVSATAHGLNALTGARDIGSFGVEFGLSLGKAIFSVPPEAKYSQVMMFLPGADYSNASDAAIAAVKSIHDHLKAGVQAAGYEIVGGEIYNQRGIRFRSINVVNPSLGCVKSENIKEQCYISITAQERKFPKEAKPSASWLVPNPEDLAWQIDHIRIKANAPQTAKLSSITAQERKFPKEAKPSASWLVPNPEDLAWQIDHIRIKANAPQTAKLSASMPAILASFAGNLPPNAWLYVAPMQIDEKWTLPYVSDGKNVHFFIEPK